MQIGALNAHVGADVSGEHGVGDLRLDPVGGAAFEREIGRGDGDRALRLAAPPYVGGPQADRTGNRAGKDNVGRRRVEFAEADVIKDQFGRGDVQRAAHAARQAHVGAGHAGRLIGVEHGVDIAADQAHVSCGRVIGEHGDRLAAGEQAHAPLPGISEGLTGTLPVGAGGEHDEARRGGGEEEASHRVFPLYRYKTNHIETRYHIETR